MTDTGIGLDEKNIDKIFERFYQGKGNKNNPTQGFGVGLDLCNQLVKLHHGKITAANRKDVEGSVFTVRIPLGKSHLSADQIEKEKNPLQMHDPHMTIQEVAPRRRWNS